MRILLLHKVIGKIMIKQAIQKIDIFLDKRKAGRANF